jgi:hypothetical protein
LEIISQSHEETVYRIDALGDAVAFVNWHKNSVTIDPAYLATPTKFPAPDTLTRIDEKIRNVKSLKLGLFGGEKV